jgi:phenylpropionate dioxygenase-like ring-hydroxylating dioxygenase large terminal subunit
MSITHDAVRQYEELVQPDRIHASLHSDPQVFLDELERIWYRSWVYIGHESEVPEPGDYVRKKFGLQPVILTRGTDGEVHVLLNKCTHVANLVCHEERGHTKAFRCPYHGWTFGLDGTCLSLPFRKAYGDDPHKEERALAKPALIGRYRGFVFASMSADVPDFMEYLGRGKDAIDQLCDLSPAGELVLTAGWLRHLTRSNWKIGLEGLVDGYHPGFVHRSMLSTVGTEYNIDASDTTYELARVRDLGNGHGDLDWRDQYHITDEEFQWMTGGTREKLLSYVAKLEEAVGPERAHQLLVDGPPHTYIFPNLFIGELFIMVLDLVSPSAHVQMETPVQWKDAEDLNLRNMHQTHAAIGPAGMILADDSAMVERNQQGLNALKPEWLVRDRGAAREEVIDGVKRGYMSDDTAILAFWSRYRQLMAS